MLSRRDAFLAFTAVAASWAVPAVAAPAQATLTWTPRALTSDQARILAAAAERIMPATDTPGAGEAGVPQFIDRALGGWCLAADAARLKEGLARLDKDARAAHGAGFADLAPDQQNAILLVCDAEARKTQPHFFSLLKDLTTAGYFTSEIGATKALRYDPVPGAYHGCVPLKEIGRAWAT